MEKFLLGIVVAAFIAAGLYYVLVLGAQEEIQEEQNSPGVNIEVGGNSAPQKHIPPGAVMEDGTI